MKEFKRANENERADPDNAISYDLRASNFQVIVHLRPTRVTPGIRHHKFYTLPFYAPASLPPGKNTLEFLK